MSDNLTEDETVFNEQLCELDADVSAREALAGFVDRSGVLNGEDEPEPEPKPKKGRKKK